MINRLLITGATGFVGKAVCEQAVHHGLVVKGGLLIRVEVPICIEPFVVGEINVATDWGSAFRDVNFLVHLAARVHVMHDTATGITHCKLGRPLELGTSSRRRWGKTVCLYQLGQSQWREHAAWASIH